VHVLISVIANRADNWVDLFKALLRRPDVELTVLAATMTPHTRSVLHALAGEHPHFHLHVARRMPGTDLTGHMASVMLRPGSGHALRSRRPDIIHIIGEPAYLSTHQVLRMRRRYWPDTPVTVYAAQNVVTQFPFPFPLVERRTYQTVDCAFPITPAALNVLRTKGYQGKACVVPLGVDTETFRPAPSPPPPRPFTVGFVGLFEPHKGIDTLLEAAERLDCDLLLIGKGSLTSRIEQAARRRPGRIEVHPWVPRERLPDLIHRMDVLTLPSVEVVQRNVLPWVGIPLKEQFGRVLVEAMACGVPVVGSNVGEIPYVIGPAGLIFSAGNASSLAACLRRVRDDAALADRLSATAVARARLFSWSRVADSMCRTWQALVEARQPSLYTRVPRHAITSASVVGVDEPVRERVPALDPADAHMNRTHEKEGQAQ
jgi:glycosyltransferase involved in cell wall biosynthesis